MGLFFHKVVDIINTEKPETHNASLRGMIQTILSFYGSKRPQAVPTNFQFLKAFRVIIHAARKQNCSAMYLKYHKTSQGIYAELLDVVMYVISISDRIM